MNGIFTVLPLILALTATGSSQDAELPVLRRSFSEVEKPLAPFKAGVFEPLQGETISFLGGTDVCDYDRHLFLETAFHLAWPDRELHLRNLAWEGDTIHYQARPQFYYTQKGDTQTGSIPDHRERTKPGIVFIGFGKMESLDGATHLPDFIAAYRKLLDELQPLTGRLVLVAPAPFFPTGPAVALMDSRNGTLGKWVAGIRALAEERGLLFVDLYTPLLADLNPALSSDGIHLTEAGHRVVADKIAEQLNFPATPAIAETQSLREAIKRKNRLWQQYYRPTNWAFLFGDRQHVPASRDPEERDQRWFVREIDTLPSLIGKAEAEIHHAARETIRK